jgi:hypothetical protein
MNIPYKHINYLKTLPQHGTDEEDAKKFEELKKNLAPELAKNIRKVSSALKEASEDGKGFGSTLTKAFNNAFSATANYQTGVAALIGTQQSLAKASQKIVAQLTQVENSFSFLNKTYGLNRQASGQVAQGYLELAKARGIDSQKVAKYAGILKKFAPLQTFAIAQDNANTNSLMARADALSKNLGVSDEATEGFLRYSAGADAAGFSAFKAGESIAAAMAGDDTEKQSFFMKQIAEDIGKAGAIARIQFGRVAGSLEGAVLKSRQLGISMADLSKTGEALLDIENSVGKELEYQLLTGNRLITQDGKSITAEYRKAQISGDMNKQADLMNTIMEQEGDTLRTNLFARQQMADLLGMSEESLAGMLEKQKFVSKFGLDESAFKLDASKFEAAVKDSAAFQELSAEKQAEEIAAMAASNLDSRTTQEQDLDLQKAIQNNTMLMAAETKKQLATKELNDLKAAIADRSTGATDDEKKRLKQLEKVIQMDGMAAMFEEAAIAVEKVTKPIQDVAEVTGKTVAENADMVSTLGQASTTTFAIKELKPVFDKLSSILGKFSGTVGKLVDATTGVITAAASSFDAVTEYDQASQDPTSADVTTTVKKGPDVYSPPGFGNRTLIMKEGQLNTTEIALKNTDTVLAGTNLFDAPTNNANNNMFAAQAELQKLLGNNTQNTQPTADPINYEKLAAAMSKISISIDPMYGASSMNNQTFQT